MSDGMDEKSRMRTALEGGIAAMEEGLDQGTPKILVKHVTIA